jgi:hypothetical protein
MGHCVGGYCDDVLGGTKRIFSLRDAKGQPHVTIETTVGKDKAGLLTEDQLPAEVLADLRRRNVTSPEFLWRYDEDLKRHVPEMGPFGSSILQIKGKQNLKPNPEYIPFVQDFIRQGQWRDIKDLGNANMASMRDLYGMKLPEGTPHYMTHEEQQAFNKQYPNLKSRMSEELDRLGLEGWEVEEHNFAEGGLVRPNNYFDDLNAFLGR